jgi:hypothetical protein
MKTTSTFKLSKTVKTMLATGRFRSQEDRSGFKRAMIDAQISGEMQSRNSQKRSKDSGQE